MKKLLVLGGLVLALAAGSVPLVRDLVSIGVKSATGVIEQGIPVGVDIQRLELSVQQLDTEVTHNGRLVVQESVALDRYEGQVKEKSQSLTQLKSDLSSLREKFVSSECGMSKTSLEPAISKRISRFKSQSQTLVTMQTALERKRESYDKMLAAFEKQKMDRDVLRDKLESFRAEYVSMKMRGELEQSALANSASRKATDLAIEIGDRLEVQRRLALQNDSDSDIELGGSTSPTREFDITDLDEVLGTAEHVAAR